MDNKERGREERRGEEKGQGACGGDSSPVDFSAVFHQAGDN